MSPATRKTKAKAKAPPKVRLGKDVGRAVAEILAPVSTRRTSPAKARPGTSKKVAGADEVLSPSRRTNQAKARPGTSKKVAGADEVLSPSRRTSQAKAKPGTSKEVAGADEVLSPSRRTSQAKSKPGTSKKAAVKIPPPPLASTSRVNAGNQNQGSENESGERHRRLSGGTINAMKKKSNPDSVFKKASHFHSLKRQILGPFIARLLISRKLDLLLEDGSEEDDTILDLSGEDDGSTVTPTTSTAVVVSRDNETGSESGASSHRDDWRREQSPFSEDD